jgi:hypothetical protein
MVPPKKLLVSALERVNVGRPEEPGPYAPHDGNSRERQNLHHRGREYEHQQE